MVHLNNLLPFIHISDWSITDISPDIMAKLFSGVMTKRELYFPTRPNLDSKPSCNSFKLYFIRYGQKVALVLTITSKPASQLVGWPANPSPLFDSIFNCILMQPQMA